MKEVFILDAYNFLFRAYYALPPLTTSQGIPVGAVYGFIKAIVKILKESNPDYLIIASDSGARSFRNDMYAEYKANRESAPDDLVPQFSILDELYEAFNIYSLKIDGYEADDIIASLVKRFIDIDDMKITIFSSDKDLTQLIEDERVILFSPINNTYLNKEYVEKKFGVSPEKIRDFLSLMGDSSDNIPGVPGIGLKTAASLLNEYGSIEGIYSNLDNMKKSKRKESLEDNRNILYLSRDLVTLDDTIDVGDLSRFAFAIPDFKNLNEFLLKYEFTSLQDSIKDVYLSGWEAVAEDVLVEKKSNLSYVYDMDVYKLLDIIHDKGNCVILVQDSLSDEYSEIQISYDNRVIYSFKVIDELDFFMDFKSVFMDNSIRKIVIDSKGWFVKLGYNFDACYCIKSMHYLLDTRSFEDNIRSIFDIHDCSFIGDGVITSCNLYNLYNVLLSKIVKSRIYSFYLDVEFLLPKIVYGMEEKGISINKEVLDDLSVNLDVDIDKISKEVYEIVGYEFNILSPQQLSEALFVKMGFPAPGKKNKSGNYSTSVEVLESISDPTGYLLASKVLQVRHLSKLKSTYAEALPKYADENNAIHTIYNICNTTTGRFSSENPNLQNIPIRSDAGRKIREAFVSREGKIFISADYSQIELRLLAYIADIKEMKIALNSGRDLHEETARTVFKEENVTPEMRRRAKAINFGIIYNISAFGLAKNLNISQSDAKVYIDSYFAAYPGIRQYMQDTKNFAYKNHYVQTLFGRSCYIKGLNDKNVHIRNMAERMAINAPLQGTAADIIRKALVKCYLALEGYEAYPLLQIHDEIVFEVNENAKDEVMDIIKGEMELVSDIGIKIPVDINYGKTLGELK